MSGFTAQQVADLFPPGIERNYWHEARHRVLVRVLAPLLGELAPGDLVLDVGCGPGFVVGFLRGRGVEAHGCDLSPMPPVSDEVAPFLHFGVSAVELPQDLRERVRVLLFMDVLEHLEDPAALLRSCRDAFPNARHVFLTVPARPEIWSNYDEYNGHFRRYTLDATAELASGGGWRVAEAAYFFHALYFAARFYNRLVGSDRRQTQMAAPRHTLPHKLLGALFDLESRLSRRALPGLWGSSLYALLSRD